MNASSPLRFAILGVLAAVGCSLINKFDPVGSVPPDAGAGNGGALGGEAGAGEGGKTTGGSRAVGGMTGTPDETGGAAGAETGGEAGQAGSGGAVSTGGTVGTSGNGGSGGSGGNGGSPVVLPGLIVAAGYDDDSNAAAGPDKKDQLLVAMAPESGKELNREILPQGTTANAMAQNGTYVAIGYDGVRDYWYLFKNTTSRFNPPGPSDIVTFEVRSFDRSTNHWTVVGAPITVPTIAAPDLAIMSQSVGYLAYPPVVDGGTVGQAEFVALVTSNPAAPVLNVGGTLPLAGTPIGLLGSFSNGIGGTATVVRQGTCVAPNCDLILRRISVSSTTLVEDAAGVTVGQYPNNGGAAWGSNIQDGLDVVALSIPGTGATISQWTPSQHNKNTSLKGSFTSPAARLGGLAYDSCNEIAFPIELLTTDSTTPSVYAVPMNGGAVSSQSLLGGQQGQHVLFEPYTRTILAPYRSGGAFGFPAYSVVGTASVPTVPVTFKKRVVDWKPETDFAPLTAAVAQPNPPICL